MHVLSIRSEQTESTIISEKPNVLSCFVKDTIRALNRTMFLASTHLLLISEAAAFSR